MRQCKIDIMSMAEASSIVGNPNCVCGKLNCPISMANDRATINNYYRAISEDYTYTRHRVQTIQQIGYLNGTLRPPLHITLRAPEVGARQDTPIRSVVHKEVQTDPPLNTDPRPVRPVGYYWHMPGPNLPRNRVCNLCGARFNWSSGARRHVKEIHRGVYQCEHCAVPYAQECHLQRHLKKREQTGKCYRENAVEIAAVVDEEVIVCQ